MRSSLSIKQWILYVVAMTLFLSNTPAVFAATAENTEKSIAIAQTTASKAAALTETVKGARAEDPVAMLKSVTSKVMSELKKNRSEIRQQPDKIYALVDHLILPHVDFIEMAKWVVGRNAWKAATHPAQKEFVVEFKTMVVRSYARSLLEYTDQEIEFLPLREAVGDQERIQVASLIKEGSQTTTHMNYHLIRSGNTWLVYDIIIEGVSLVQGYHAQFADDVREGGVDQATETMRRRNNSKGSQ